MGKLNVSLPTTSIFFSHISLNDTLRKFREIEKVPEVSATNPDDSLCENIYRDTVIHTPQDHYEVSLPFCIDSPTFLGIRELALNRFLSLERRLIKHPKLYAEYSDFMR